MIKKRWYFQILLWDDIIDYIQREQRFVKICENLAKTRGIFCWCGFMTKISITQTYQSNSPASSLFSFHTCGEKRSVFRNVLLVIIGLFLTSCHLNQPSSTWGGQKSLFLSLRNSVFSPHKLIGICRTFLTYRKEISCILPTGRNSLISYRR